jgi:hypothetical protein
VLFDEGADVAAGFSIFTEVGVGGPDAKRSTTWNWRSDDDVLSTGEAARHLLSTYGDILMVRMSYVEN